MKSWLVVLAVGSLALFAAPARADVDSLEGAAWGDTWLNTERSPDSLKGHVVLWENWADDGPCLMAMGTLSKMQEKYAALGLVVIGNQAKDGATREKTCALCRAYRVNYTITNGGKLAGDTMTGLNVPNAWLFAPDGKLVKEGNPQVVAREIEALVQKWPHWITRGKAVTTPAGKAISEGLKAGRPLSWALAECEVLLKKSDEKPKAEAQYFKDQILAEAEAMLVEAKAAESGDPPRALELYTGIANGLGKTEPAKKAEARLKELRDDKAFQEELKLAKEVAQIRALCAGLVVSNEGVYDMALPRNAAAVKQIVPAARSLKEKHGDSAVVKRLLEELPSYGISVP